MAHEIRHDWTTKAGLRAVSLQCTDRPYSNNHFCGYVGVPASSPLYGKEYSEQIDLISQEDVDHTTIGKKGLILALTATVGADTEESIRRSLDVLIDVHGGMTYSRTSPDYPVDSDLHWFGFDCAHGDDDYPDGGQPYEYVCAECESMAEQLAALVERQPTLS